MSKHFIRLSLPLVLLFAAVCFGQSTWPTDPLPRLQAVAPGGDAKPLKAGDYKVLQWKQGTDAAGKVNWAAKPLEVGAMYQFSDHFVVENKSTPPMWGFGWKNDAGEIICSPAEFVTLDQLVKQLDCPPLPAAPKGWKLRVVARLPERATRMASDGSGTFLYVLMQSGDVKRLDVASGKFSDVFSAADYCGGGGSALGMMLDQSNRLYIVVNTADGNAIPMMAHVTIYRTTSVKNGLPAEAKPWVTAQYPYGIDVFNHGVSYIATGPDGMIYVSSGSRTDHGEKGNDPNRSTEGEDRLTGCIWRIDPKAAKPQIEIYARGLRNAFTFCWDDRGRLFSSENGPNADAPEEMNQIQQGKHYGFPYVFSNYTQKVYPDQPDAPPGMKFELPIMNVGPDAGGSAEKPLGTFDPHSSPSGMVYLGQSAAVPAASRGTFLVSRFGCFLGAKDVGFDVVQVKVESEKPWTISTREFLPGLGRPIDLHYSGGKVFICEYSRETKRGNGMDLPGRILELAPELKR